MKFSAPVSLIARAIIATALVTVSVSIVFGQDKAVKAEKIEKADVKVKSKEFCSQNNWSNGDKVSFSELREMNVPASGSINVDGGKNGGIRVRGENRSDVLVRACVQTWSESDAAAKSSAANVRIGTAGTIKADGADDSNWSVSYDIRVPNATNLRLFAHNGGISISSVDGTMDFETTNGGVSLSDVAGNVRGKTTNGGVNVELTGNSWRGEGLDVRTSNGGVHLSMPDTYAANVETGTVNGGFKSEISSLNVATENIVGGHQRRPTTIVQSINGGGAPIRVLTTNGGVKISSTNSKY